MRQPQTSHYWTTAKNIPQIHFFLKMRLSKAKVRALVQHGPCQPGLKDNFSDFVANSCNEKFKIHWYKNTSGKVSTDRHWLVYSRLSAKMFWFCCWLFAEKGDQTIWSDPNKGFDAYHKGMDRIKHHEELARHRKAEKTLFITKYRITQDKTVIAGLVQAERLTIEKNRRVLKRLVDLTLFLANQGLPFRGHREYAGLGAPTVNEGNFLELLKLLAKYDTIIDNHISELNRGYKYISPESQNEIITCLGNETLQMIVKEIKDAFFYSVIADSTIDISRVDQFSLSIRYVNESGKSVERFIKFDELSSGSAESFHDSLIKALQELRLNASNMRGQAYDGAKTMSGHISGLQKRVKDSCSSQALYVHCCAHNLNLILLDSATSCTTGKLFFGTLEQLYCFLTLSLPRYRILTKQQDKMIQDTALTLKRFSDTRWASRKHATDAVMQNMPAIIAALEIIIDDARSEPRAVADAKGLLATLNIFEFMFMLNFWNTLLGKTYSLSNYLQKESIDLNAAIDQIDSCANALRGLRSEEGFNNIEAFAKEQAKECDTSTEFRRLEFKQENVLQMNSPQMSLYLTGGHVLKWRHFITF
ncbi:zinc finger MYM-type protein 1-like [Acanthochromis polyacanthus]|uniref:zinc finger MYM-type protein 1-like n=1 Tax=Acanthochromis polyacanthus TaxID=80966 RepID=UPI0022344C09|nr:zinc finger MYM-type protein 1-like [Acanthochromis polyacanthus]